MCDGMMRSSAQLEHFLLELETKVISETREDFTITENPTFSWLKVSIDSTAGRCEIGMLTLRSLGTGGMVSVVSYSRP